MFNPYEVLGITKDVKQEDLKGIYRELIHQYHPDKVATLPEEQQKEAEKKFTEIQEAYDLLKYPEKRKLYDESGYIDPSESKIKSSVQSALRVLLNNYLSRGEQIFTIDIIKSINDYCIVQIETCKKTIGELKSKKLFLLKVINKFKKKQTLKVDFLSNVFIGEMNSLDQSINRELENMLIFTQVKIVINEYEFDFMKVLECGEFDIQPNKVSLGNIFELAGVVKSVKN